MDEYDNVECTRCGKKWYSRKFEEDGEVPENCTGCYRGSVREIPPPPTFLDKCGDTVDYWREELPRRWGERKHQIILWKENNSILINMIGLGIIFIAITGIMAYMLFK